MPRSRDTRAPTQARRAGAHGAHAGAAGLTLAALGVVFGDIGTSPLYAMQTAFAGGGMTPDKATVYGIISLIVWTVTVIVSLKYVSVVMRADNEGEGGIMALIAMIQTLRRGHGARVGLIALGLFGAALFYGDGMITPAISVMSAVEGLEVVQPSLEAAVVPITLGIITGLFALQRFGTAAVGRLFGPVMVVWFAVLAALGAGQVARHPEVLAALSPGYAGAFIAHEPLVAFIALASVVLTVTGAEALYADMGHFGRAPIRRAWFWFVFPALTLNYLGQGALIVADPKAAESPFFLLVPDWARLPMIGLATIATVIASQAVISGAFSVTRQAVQLGFLPRMTIRHTSSAAGQVYLPGVNWGIYAAVAALVVGFGSSHALASAYGIAVTGTLAIDTVLFFVVARRLLGLRRSLAIAGAGAFLAVDMLLFGATLTKVLSGGWFPLLIAAGIFTVLITWQRGRQIVTAKRIESEGSLAEFVAELAAMDPPLARVPGTAVFLNQDPRTTPLALRENALFNRVLHEQVLVVSVLTEKVPHVDPAERLVVDHLGERTDQISHLTVRVGFQDEPDVPAALTLAAQRGVLEGPVDVEGAIYFLSRIRVVRTEEAGLCRWRKRLFVAISRNAADPVGYFCLPLPRTVVMGSQIGV